MKNKAIGHYLAAAYIDLPYLDRDGYITYPHDLASNAVDVVKKIENIEAFGGGLLTPSSNTTKVVDAAWTQEHGIIAVFKIPLPSLFYNGICSTLQYIPKYRKKIEMATQANIINMYLQSGPNHNIPNFLYAPKMPVRNKIAEQEKLSQFYNIKQIRDFHNRPVLNDTYVQKMFPNIDFDNNLLLEKCLAKTIRNPSLAGRSFHDKADSAVKKIIKKLHLNKHDEHPIAVASLLDKNALQI